MRLKALTLSNFKNYREANIAFDGNVVAIVGKNGSGKTNLLEAIHYLSMTRGFSSHPDNINAREGSDEFEVKGTFEKRQGVHDVVCTWSTGKKKRMSEDGREYARFSEHIGKYPLVMIAPADIEMIWTGGEIRRRFFDTLLSQLDKDYLEALSTYQNNLKQRNSLLRMFAERGSFDPLMLETYDEKMALPAKAIFGKRKQFIGTILPGVHDRYTYLSGGAEETGITYQSDLQNSDFRELMAANRNRDMGAGRTTGGVHRDEFQFLLQGHPLEQFGSQGQQKSFLVALKLTEFEMLGNSCGFKPLLLLDDIFDKLDDDRIRRLMELVWDDVFGQIIITDARGERSKELLKGSSAVQCFLVEGGTLKPA